MRRNGLALLLIAAVTSACGGPAPSETTSPDSPAVTPVLGELTADTDDAWVYVGGIQVDRVPGANVDPAIDAQQAAEVVAEELAAGRARLIGTHEDEPPMHTVDAAFVPALVRTISPAGGTDFEPPEPVAAWVIVSEGRGSDGLYIGVGVVGQDGVPLAVYVITPGVG